MYLRNLLVLLTLLWSLQPLFSQERISYSFKNEPLDKCLEKISADQGVKIAYIQDWTTGIMVTGEFSSSKLQTVIDQIVRKYHLNVVEYSPTLFVLTKPLKQGDVLSDSVPGRKKENRIVIGDPSDLSIATISGSITDANDNSTIVGARVFIESLGEGAFSDVNGRFELTLPVGNHEIDISSIGYNEDKLKVILQSNGSIEIKLVNKVNNLDEITVTGLRDLANVEGQASVNIIDAKQTEFQPSLMGDPDIIKTIELLPGVNSTGEAANGFSVRGGNAGQNLVLLEGAPIYNANHLFGFVSVFNGGLVESAKIYKGALPAQYGGRVASVTDVQLKGRSEEWHGNISAGLMSSRIGIEGPVNDKLSVATGARFSYVDRYLKQFKNPDLKNGTASFYDTNLKVISEISENNTLEVNGFISSDEFSLLSSEQINYDNQVASIGLNHTFSEDIVGHFSIAYSGYNSENISSDSLQDRSVSSQIMNLSNKNQISIFSIEDHALTGGIETALTHINPGTVRSTIPEPSVIQIQKEKALEFSLFLIDDYKLSDQIQVGGGLRFSSFFLFGPRKVYSYAQNETKQSSSVTDSTFYGNQVVKSFGGIEPRLFVIYSLDNSTDLKLNFGRSIQYMHLISNTASVSPLNIWKLSDSHLNPQIANQVALGITRDLPKNVDIELEGYLKKVSNVPDYKDGADLLSTENLETVILSGESHSFGVELLVRQSSDKFNGWISYTFSRSLNKVDSAIPENQINDGQFYSSQNDRPHAISMVGDYQLSRLWSISYNWVYYSGSPVSFPEAIYYHDQSQVAYYSERNSYRMPDYHRLDVSLNFKGSSLKKNKRWDVNWSFSVYNIYSRNNAYSIYFARPGSSDIARTGQNIVGRKLTILPDPIPSFTMQVKF